MIATAGQRSAGAVLLGGLVMFWMLLLGMIGTGLIGPNPIEREFSLSHGGFSAALAVIQIACSPLVLSVAAGMPLVPQLGRIEG